MPNGGWFGVAESYDGVRHVNEVKQR